MQKKLDVAVSIAIVVVAVLLSVTLIRLHMARKNAQTASSEAALAASLQPGKLLVAPEGYHWQNHPRTLLLAMRYGCSHCENNMALYQEMQHLMDNKKLNAYLLSVFPDDPFVAQHDLDTHDLHGMSLIANVSFAHLNIFGTPTLLLVDDHGTILHSWIGELSTQQQDEVMKTIQFQ